jgi:hypothetical protein
MISLSLSLSLSWARDDLADCYDREAEKCARMSRTRRNTSKRPKRILRAGIALTARSPLLDSVLNHKMSRNEYRKTYYVVSYGTSRGRSRIPWKRRIPRGSKYRIPYPRLPPKTPRSSDLKAWTAAVPHKFASPDTRNIRDG